jgi:hypothetical protein
MSPDATMKKRVFQDMKQETEQRKLDNEKMSKRDLKIPEKFIVCDNYL